MPNIQPIETAYAGRLFRSRLEARWAVFFDAMRCRWEYEPEGFRMPDGSGYLPDFRLAGRLWVEIKPLIHPEMEDLGKARLRMLCIPTPSLLVAGDPGEYRSIWYDEYEGEVFDDRIDAQFAQCRRCSALALYHEWACLMTCRDGCQCEKVLDGGDAHSVRAATKAALACRFDGARRGAPPSRPDPFPRGNRPAL